MVERVQVSAMGEDHAENWSLRKINSLYIDWTFGFGVYLTLFMTISRILLFMRISSSRLASVRFVMRVHWITSVCCGGIIIVPRAVASGCVSFWSTRRGFQSWFIFIWFVAALCCIRSDCARNAIICWSLSCGTSRAEAIWSALCHTLSLKMFRSFSSFVDNVCVPSFRWLGYYSSVNAAYVAYIVMRTFRLDHWSSFG